MIRMGSFKLEISEIKVLAGAYTEKFPCFSYKALDEVIFQQYVGKLEHHKSSEFD